MAGAFGLVPLAVVPIEIEDDDAAEEVLSELAEYDYIAVVRMADLTADVEHVLSPAIRRRAPQGEQQEAIRRRKAEFRGLRLPALVRGVATGAVMAIGTVLFFLAALIWDLLRYAVPVGLVGLLVYLALNWIGLL